MPGSGLYRSRAHCWRDLSVAVLLDISRSTQAWVPDGDGAQVAFRSLSNATRERRRKVRAKEDFDKDDFFGGDKPAERGRGRRSR